MRARSAIVLVACLALGFGLSYVHNPTAAIGIALSLIFAISVAWQYFRPGSSRGGPDYSDPLFLAGVVVFLLFGLRAIVIISGTVSDNPSDMTSRSVLGP